MLKKFGLVALSAVFAVSIGVSGGGDGQRQQEGSMGNEVRADISLCYTFPWLPWCN